MKVLVIEDDPNKATQVLNFLNELESISSVAHKRSYQSGLKELYDSEYNLVLLDMSLPTYDIRPGEDAYKFRHLAGHDILSEIKRKKKLARVIIVTQFERFGEGRQYISLKDLRMTLRLDFPESYVDTISYHPGRTTWKEELVKLIEKEKRNDKDSSS
ncbi:MAG: response regulator [Imperialibacter sp.]|uniref:response regulator n=1 Tax=Imperialibacter sp. TaxID=2038411 RepID=UPI003A87A277